MTQATQELLDERQKVGHDRLQTLQQLIEMRDQRSQEGQSGLQTQAGDDLVQGAVDFLQDLGDQVRQIMWALGRRGCVGNLVDDIDEGSVEVADGSADGLDGNSSGSFGRRRRNFSGSIVCRKMKIG